MSVRDRSADGAEKVITFQAVRSSGSSRREFKRHRDIDQRSSEWKQSKSHRKTRAAGNTWRKIREKERRSEKAQKVIIEHSESACANHVCNAFAFCFWSFYAFFDFPILTFCGKQSRKESLKIAPKNVPIFSCSKYSSSNLF